MQHFTLLEPLAPVLPLKCNECLRVRSLTCRAYTTEERPGLHCKYLIDF